MASWLWGTRARSGVPSCCGRDADSSLARRARRPLSARCSARTTARAGSWRRSPRSIARASTSPRPSPCRGRRRPLPRSTAAKLPATPPASCCDPTSCPRSATSRSSPTRPARDGVHTVVGPRHRRRAAGLGRIPRAADRLGARRAADLGVRRHARRASPGSPSLTPTTSRSDGTPSEPPRRLARPAGGRLQRLGRLPGSAAGAARALAQLPVRPRRSRDDLRRAGTRGRDRRRRAAHARVHDRRAEAGRRLPRRAAPTQKVLQPAGCPFGVEIDDRVQGDPAWSMVTYPAVRSGGGRRRLGDRPDGRRRAPRRDGAVALRRHGRARAAMTCRSP